MTIHTDHPFVPADDDKNSFRRLRGRLPAPVTVVATGTGRARVGLTVSSVVLVDGPAPAVTLFVDPDTDLADALVEGGRAVVTVLAHGDDFLAEVFAGQAPAPGGMFTRGSWIDSPWGPRLDDRSWLGFTVAQTLEVGWSLQVTGAVGEIGLADSTGLAHARGRFRGLD